MGTGVFPQYISSKQLGAPQMGSRVSDKGQIITVLDACLVKGFGDTTVADTRIEGEFVVLNFGVIHRFLRFQYVSISGATDTNLNGNKKVLKVTATEIYLEKGSVSDLTGTIVVKVAPLGWKNVGSTSNKLLRAYQSTVNPTLNKILHLDCNLPTASLYGATNPIKKAVVSVVDTLPSMVGFKSLTNDYLGNKRAVDGLFHWVQAIESTNPSLDIESITDIDWIIIGDNEFFYFFVYPQAGENIALANNNSSPFRRTGYCFGRVPTSKYLGIDSTFISARMLDIYANNTVDITGYSDGSGVLTAYIQGYKGNSGYMIGSASSLEPYRQTASVSLNFVSTNLEVSGARGGISYLRSLDAGLVLSDVFLKDEVIGLGGWKLPYLKSINTDLGYTANSNTYDQRTLDDGTLLVGLGINYYYGNNTFVAFSLLEERESDLLS